MCVRGEGGNNLEKKIIYIYIGGTALISCAYRVRTEVVLQDTDDEDARCRIEVIKSARVCRSYVSYTYGVCPVYKDRKSPVLSPFSLCL